MFGGATTNTYTGLTTVNDGSLVLHKNPGVDSLGGDIVVGDGSNPATLSMLTPNQIPDSSSVTVNEARRMT